ncbi:M23 family metallopeptidase [Paenibacillus sp. SYP-B3998]|uniref:M23 family metallopeptidase n=1 Tax=Paenibacillus sp. SYP-B3998 TaxID=2678564 RepID=A0A6G4A0X4_9BACL|nr:M23 family metallopeptidase [Paenibacillus sp. SYP-B3998]NEW07297.1 M23 family metallopeptidase [Paenibacillus sp. SYP-B3998]
MTGFRGIRFVMDLIERFKSKRESLTGSESDKQQQEVTTTTTLAVMKRHKWPLVLGIGAIALTGAITFAGHQYVEAGMVNVYHVMLNDQEIGIVSDNKIIDEYKQNRPSEVQQNFPDVHMVLETNGITYRAERAYSVKSDDEAVIASLNTLLIPKPTGVELKVDGKMVAIVKDQTTAELILEQVREPFKPKGKQSTKVAALSASMGEDISTAPSELDKVEFIQQVDKVEIPIDPKELAKPEDVVKKLQTGNVQPAKYTVVEGDCVSCIAKKLGISKQFIYDNNPGIQDDKLKIGNQLDVTVLQPTLSVKTTERIIKNQEIQYDTEYVKDDSMRVGIVQPISAGKNGLKKVTIQVTKVDGLMKDEKLIDEEIIDKPVTAKVKKGTKVIQGEGTGKFAWPVVSPSISSTFGVRWGKLHKGIDITGNKNIMAADNGKVIETGYKSDYGNYVIINHLNGYETLYGHMSKVTTSEGTIVEKGDKIGIMGSTGDSTGVHLHFEVHNSGELQNPLKYLNR